MTNSIEAPRLTNGGVMFAVTVDFRNHECFVSQQTLYELSKLCDRKLDLLDAYGAYEARIKGVARRLIAAGISGSPVLLEAKYFG